MRQRLWLLLLILLPGIARAQVVDHKQVRKYAGEEVTVRGPIARAQNMGGGTIWLSLGKPHPSATLVVVVPAELVGNFGDPRSYEGAVIEVQGRILTGEMGGIGIDPTIAGAIRGGAPKTPYIVLKNASRIQVVVPPPAPSGAPPSR
jgi:hypothetical protein